MDEHSRDQRSPVPANHFRRELAPSPPMGELAAGAQANTVAASHPDCANHRHALEQDDEQAKENLDSLACDRLAAVTQLPVGLPAQPRQQGSGGAHSTGAGPNQPHSCFECGRSLAKSRHLIHVAGQRHRTWHPECFRCQVCQHPLDREPSCHLYKDRIVCRADYVKLQRERPISCARCNWPIAASDWVRKAGDSFVYHLACFSCDVCLRQLSTGEQFTISHQPATRSDEADNQSAGPLVDEPSPLLLCRLHFAIQHNDSSSSSNNNNNNKMGPLDAPNQSSSPNMMHQYGSPIQAPNRMSTQHHYSAKHGSQAADEYSTAANGRRCPPNLVSGSPQNQHQLPEANNMAHRHLSGPNGLACQTSADQFGRLAIMSGRGDEDDEDDDDDIDDDEDMLAGRDLGPNGLHRMGLNSAAASSQLGMMSMSASSGSSGSSSSSSKSKRVRTTFTEDQLSILQTHFQIDSNPDGQDLERIATITGLSKRVTQVWFQNSRARQKKHLIKRKPSLAAAAAAAVAAAALNGSRHHGSGLDSPGAMQAVHSMSLIGELKASMGRS